MSKFIRIEFVEDTDEGLPISYPFYKLENVGGGEDDLYELEDEEYQSEIEDALDAEPRVVSYKWINYGS